VAKKIREAKTNMDLNVKGPNLKVFAEWERYMHV
jgi:hypothetical protein